MERQVAVTPDAVAKIVATLTPAQMRIVYDFAEFLRSRTETSVESDLDNAAWDKSFAETDTEKLQSWLDNVMAEGPTTEMVIKDDRLISKPGTE